MLTTDLQQVVSILQKGGIAIFPTDTVWGMGCSLQSLDAIQRFYEIKGREKNKPTAVLVGSIQQAEEIADFTPYAQKLAELYWPGALTIITHVKPGVPKEILGDFQTVGVRFPDFQIVQQMTQMLGTGIVTGSANFAGGLAPNKKELIDQRLVDLADVVFDGECGDTLPSTVVDASGEELKIIRQGSIFIQNNN